MLDAGLDRRRDRCGVLFPAGARLPDSVRADEKCTVDAGKGGDQGFAVVEIAAPHLDAALGQIVQLRRVARRRDHAVGTLLDEQLDHPPAKLAAGARH